MMLSSSSFLRILGFPLILLYISVYLTKSAHSENTFLGKVPQNKIEIRHGRSRIYSPRLGRRGSNSLQFHQSETLNNFSNISMIETKSQSLTNAEFGGQIFVSTPPPNRFTRTTVHVLSGLPSSGKTTVNTNGKSTRGLDVDIGSEFTASASTLVLSTIVSDKHATTENNVQNLFSKHSNGEDSDVNDIDNGIENYNITDDESFVNNSNDKSLATQEVSRLLDDKTELPNILPETRRAGTEDIVTKFLRIVESQHLLGDNCTAGTDLNLGEGVVDRYAQERFRVEADVAVNRANMLTRLWKYADPDVMNSEYLLHASVFSMVEFDDDIFAAGNCYDQHQYKEYLLFCPYAYRLPEGPILVKDLAVEYKYLSNTSEWFYIARKNAEKVIQNYKQFSRGYNTYTYNETAHTERVPDKILSVTYEDGKWSKPYYDCGGGNIWMLTYTVPFFGYQNGTYFFKGTSGIDIDLRRVDIDQCPLPPTSTQLNIFASSNKCKQETTECVPIPGLGFRRGSYKCVCRRGYYFPDTKALHRYYNGTVIEEEYEKFIMNEKSSYNRNGMFECLKCAEGCDSCKDDRPCVVSLNWVMRTAILILSCVVICCLPIVVLFTWKYGKVKVVRAASPVLLRVITLGALFIYSTNIVMYPQPSVYTCTVRVWLREIGFSLTYGALMLKTWRISVIFRVRSAKAVKITDLDLLKRLGIIVLVFSVFLAIRTLVAPAHVIVGRTADDLKAFLCPTDWWDHSFTSMEVMFLVWGIRLCIVVRKAPSEFNESRFISMAIYNEFLLSSFLNISMLFLQKPANPDLLYIIFFCHTQLTVTLLLGLIFGSKAYMVFKGQGKLEDTSSMVSKPQTSRVISKARSLNSQCAPSTNSSSNVTPDTGHLTDADVQEEFQRIYMQLDMLKERNMKLGNRHYVAKISAMQEAAKQYFNDTLIEEPEHNDSEFKDINNILPNVQGKRVTLNISGISLSAKCSSDISNSSPNSNRHQRNQRSGKVILEHETLAVIDKKESKVTEKYVSNASVSEIPDSQLIHANILGTKEPFLLSELCDSDVNTLHREKTNKELNERTETSDKNKYSDTNIVQIHTNNGNVKGSFSERSSPCKNVKQSPNLKDNTSRKRAIVINLDDKNRFSEEVTV